jgi:hypothetical protein
MKNGLKYRLRNWTDTDVAEYELGVLLGLWPEWNGWRGLKWVFWVLNPLGEMLHRQLEDMVVLGMLLKDEKGSRFKWNEAYVFKQPE